MENDTRTEGQRDRRDLSLLGRDGIASASESVSDLFADHLMVVFGENKFLPCFGAILIITSTNCSTAICGGFFRAMFPISSAQ